MHCSLPNNYSLNLRKIHLHLFPTAEWHLTFLAPAGKQKGPQHESVTWPYTDPIDHTCTLLLFHALSDFGVAGELVSRAELLNLDCVSVEAIQLLNSDVEWTLRGERGECGDT